MSSSITPSDLRPGDCLLYYPTGLFGWLIALKTWNRVSHVEVYAGNGKSVASRDGRGVSLYPFRSAELCRVLRPVGDFDISKAIEWFIIHADGQSYDWKGILVFTLAVHEGARDKMFCSEFATRFYRAGGFHPFAEDYDADHIAPAQFLQSPKFQTVWLKPTN